MGMDVHGREPLNETGEYFRNNVWWWRPLWDYCLEVAPVARKVKHGHSNDGDGLGKRDSVALATKLREEIASGRCAEYAAEYKKGIDAIPLQTCDLCGGTGLRPDWERFGEEWRKNCNGCNGCNGEGKRKSMATWYPFSVENVEEFCVFLENCGGFSID